MWAEPLTGCDVAYTCLAIAGATEDNLQTLQIVPFSKGWLSVASDSKAK
jgi:hypothetical protein